MARALSADYELMIYTSYNPMVNDPDLTAPVRAVAEGMLGAENVRERRLAMGGEDFCYFAEKAPGCFIFMGGAAPDGEKRRHHHPRFDIDERCLPIGAALLAEAAVRFLEEANRQ